MTFATSAVEELIAQAEVGCARTRVIEVVWVVQEHSECTCISLTTRSLCGADSAAPLLPVFAALLARASTIHTLAMRITIHYTRAASSLPANLSALVGHDRIAFEAGRPKLTQVVDEVVRRTAVHGSAGGVVVGVCGPQPLVEDVWRAERAVGSEMRSAVGGVEVHEE